MDKMRGNKSKKMKVKKKKVKCRTVDVEKAGRKIGT